MPDERRRASAPTSASARSTVPQQRHSFSRARARRRHADRQLVPVALARTLEVRVADLAEQMRAAGITRKLVAREVKHWLAEPVQAPTWFAPALEAARAAAQQHQADQVGSDPGPAGPAEPRTGGRDSEQARLEEFLAELRAVTPARRR